MFLVQQVKKNQGHYLLLTLTEATLYLLKTLKLKGVKRKDFDQTQQNEVAKSMEKTSQSAEFQIPKSL